MKRKLGSDCSDIERFIRGAFLRGDVERIELRQKQLQGDARVHDWVFDEEDEETQYEPETIAEELYERAQQDGKSFKGVVTYFVLYYRKDEEAYASRFSFRVRGSGDSDSTDETEEPTKEGITSQLMRHNEALVRSGLGSMVEVVRYYQKILETQQKAIDASDARMTKILELHEDLSSRKHERDKDQRKEAQEDKNRQLVIEKLGLLLPAVATKLMGPGPGQPMLGEESLRTLLKSLTPEQLDKVGAALAPEQMAVVATLYETYAKDEKEEETNHVPTPPPS